MLLCLIQTEPRGYPENHFTIQTWLGGTPHQHHPDMAGVPLYPRDGVHPTIQTCLGYPPPPRHRMGYPPPTNINRQTPVKTVPSHRTMYADSNKMEQRKFTDGSMHSPYTLLKAVVPSVNESLGCLWYHQ